MGLEINPFPLTENHEEVSWAPIFEEIQTKYQLIKFYETEDKKLILTLNSFVQFIEGIDEQNYHDNLILPALAANKNAKKVLILGGGDGLGARTLLKQKPDIDITLVELDEKMIEIFRTWPRLKELNEESLSKCTVYIENALYWVPRNASKSFDIIYLDFPDPTSQEIKKLYSTYFLSDVVYLLKGNGILAMQCHPDSADKVSLRIKEILGNEVIVRFKMPNLEEGTIIMGCK
jgi:spermidine synthase